ncbi:MAG: hypothetical protein ACI9JN_001560 [Bacteroidia bacterium]|jgi:hypothetical protein
MRFRLTKHTGLFVILCFLFLGCEKDILIPQYTGFGDNYLEIRVNTTWNYRVDSVFSDSDTFGVKTKYYERHVIEDSVLIRNELTYMVQVYRSDDSLGTFVKFRNYNLILNSDKIEYESPKLSLVILTTPLEMGRSWDNQHTECQYRVSRFIGDVLYDTDLNGTKYKNVVNVEHCSFQVFDRNNRHNCLYAEKVGLVRESISHGTYNRLGNYRTLTSLTRSLINYAY